MERSHSRFAAAVFCPGGRSRLVERAARSRLAGETVQLRIDQDRLTRPSLWQISAIAVKTKAETGLCAMTAAVHS
jgi:hypothetical protein